MTRRPEGNSLKTLLLLTFLALSFTACGGGGDDPAPTATAEGAAAGPDAAGRISIPSIGVDAPLTLKRLVVGEALPSPDGPRDVAIYDFTSESDRLGGVPGEGGNVVLAGPNIEIVNCAPAQPPCNAVFARLRNLNPGAVIDVTWQGRLLSYQVVAMCNVPTRQFGDGIYRRTPEEQLTLLTGAGNLNLEAGWSHVLIVIAKPAPQTAFEACPLGTFTGHP